MSDSADEAIAMSEASSDSEGSFEEIEANEEDIQAINGLEDELQANPNLYDKHTEYISLLRKCKMRARLTAARQAMHNKFPLSENLWVEWLDDEIAASHGRHSSEIQELFGLAVQDYLSIPIWVKYITFLAENDSEVKQGTAQGKEKMRDAYESALSAGGIHMSQGSQLWRLSRKFEQQHGVESNNSNVQDPVSSLFYRQLQVPLVDNADTAKELLEFSGGGDLASSLPEQVRRGQAKAQAMAQARQSYEESVAPERPADTELLANFMAYIKLEECLYERAIARFPVTHVLWLQYAQYVEQHMPLPKVVNALYARAVRNCPWVGPLWARGLRALERGGGSEEEQQALYDSALAAGMESPEDYLDVSLARLDALRRRGPSQMEALRSAFQATTDLMQTYFPDFIDRSVQIPAYWAACEAEMAEAHENAREVWEAALRTPLNMYAEAILAYVAFEVAEKRYKEARSIFRKFHRRQLKDNGGATLCESWLRFEREHGSAEDYFQAACKTKDILYEALAAATAAANPHAAQESKAAVSKAPKPDLSKAEKKRLRQEKDPNFKGKASKQPKPDAVSDAGASSSANAGGPMGPPNKRKTPGIGFDSKKESSKRQRAELPAEQRSTKFVSSGEHALSAEATAADDVRPSLDSSSAPSTFLAEGTGAKVITPNGTMGPPKPRPAKGPVASEQPRADPPAETGSSENPGKESYKRKCYIKSIPAKLTRAEVQQLMEPCGQIVDFSMPEDRRMPARHRGFAYVTFASHEGLLAALRMNGQEVAGQSLSVAVAHQEVSEGQKEAFVLNVPLTSDSTGLEAFFTSACGPIKSLRLPLDKDTSQLRGKNLKISISNQPMGGRTPVPTASRGLGRGGRGRAGPPRGGGRGGRAFVDVQGSSTSNTFRPRSVAQGRGTHGASKSNEEFRALLKN